MIESIEKLRERVLKYAPNIRRVVCMALDEIEAEIESRYIELPADADGVPWHIGDAIKGHGELRCMSLDKYGWAFAGSTAIDPRLHCHVNQRTIEDVLRDLVDGIGSVEFDALTAIGEAADEIRELMEVGA